MVISKGALFGIQFDAVVDNKKLVFESVNKTASCMKVVLQSRYPASTAYSLGPAGFYITPMLWSQHLLHNNDSPSTNIALVS